MSLARSTLVTGAITQGRWDRGLGQEWSTQLRVQYWSHGVWVDEGGVKPGNVDTMTPVLVTLEPGVVTDMIRVVPVSEYPRTVCIRLELCGCDPDDISQDEFEDVHDEVHDIKEELQLREVDSPQDHPSSGTNRTLHYNNSNFMSVVIGVLVTVILILTAVIIFILYNNNKSSLQQRHVTTTNSTTSVPIKYDYTDYHSLPTSDYVSHYSNDSYTEYSRPLLGNPTTVVTI